MKIGDIFWVSIPKTSGHEQYGHRPAIIHKDVNMSIIISMTTSEKALNFENTLEIFPDNLNNLSKRSIALIFQILTIDNKWFDKK